MAPKHLSELLVEEQELFFHDANISDRRHLLKRPSWPLIHRKSISFSESFLNSCFCSSSFQYDVPRSPVPLPRTATMNDTILEADKRSPKGCDLLDGKKQRNSAAGTGTGTVELLFRTLTKLGRRSGKRESGHHDGGSRVLVRDILRRTISDPGDILKLGKANTNKIQNSDGHNDLCIASESSDVPSGSKRREVKESLNVVEKSSFRCPTPESWLAAGSPSRYELEDKDNAVEVRADEKEKSSPVSVLVPPSFDDDMEEHDFDVNGYRLEYADSFDHETSPSRHYGFCYDNLVLISWVGIGIGTNQMLLRNLYMFQRRLLGLDLFELEERPVEQDGAEDQNARKMRVTKGMMKMVSDLIVGEQETKESVIEMGWRRDHSLEDTAEEIELAILGALVGELSDRI